MTSYDMMMRVNHIQSLLDDLKWELARDGTTPAPAITPPGLNPVRCSIDFGQQDHIGE